MGIFKKKEKEESKPKEIKETKCVCEACQNVWYYGKRDEKDSKRAVFSNASKRAACCTGCLPALLIPDQKVLDLNKCPKCGSSAIKKEEVTHHVPAGSSSD